MTNHHHHDRIDKAVVELKGAVYERQDVLDIVIQVITECQSHLHEGGFSENLEAVLKVMFTTHVSHLEDQRNNAEVVAQILATMADIIKVQSDNLALLTRLEADGT